jgi:hypothetical protein
MTTHMTVARGLVLKTQVLSGANSHGGGSRQAPDKRSEKKGRVYAAPGLSKINWTVDMHKVTAVAEGPQHDRHCEMHSDELGVRHG